MGRQTRETDDDRAVRPYEMFFPTGGYDSDVFSTLDSGSHSVMMCPYATASTEPSPENDADVTCTSAFQQLQKSISSRIAADAGMGAG